MTLFLIEYANLRPISTEERRWAECVSRSHRTVDFHRAFLIGVHTSESPATEHLACSRAVLHVDLVVEFTRARALAIWTSHHLRATASPIDLIMWLFRGLNTLEGILTAGGIWTDHVAFFNAADLGWTGIEIRGAGVSVRACNIVYHD